MVGCCIIILFAAFCFLGVRAAREERLGFYSDAFLLNILIRRTSAISVELGVGKCEIIAASNDFPDSIWQHSSRFEQFVCKSFFHQSILIVGRHFHVFIFLSKGNEQIE
jgi:hypothetical protein